MRENKMSPGVAIGIIAVVVIVAAAAIWQFSGARRTTNVSPDESKQHVPTGKPMGAGPRWNGGPGGPPRMGPPGGMGGSGR